MEIKTWIDMTPGAEYIVTSMGMSTLIVDKHEYKYIAKIWIWVQVWAGLNIGTGPTLF